MQLGDMDLSTKSMNYCISCAYVLLVNLYISDTVILLNSLYHYSIYITSVKMSENLELTDP